ncbi:MFS transporter [Halonotius pteroides]|nr:MFS transporter [Halonotius pteroides]
MDSLLQKRHTVAAYLIGGNSEILEDTNLRLLLLTNLVTALGFAPISPVLSSLVVPLQATEGSIGLIVTVFAFPSLLVIPIVGVASDLVGRKRLLLFGLIIHGFGGGLIPFTTDFGIILLLRLVQGVGYAILVPVILTSIGDAYGQSEETTAQGLRFASTGLAETVFPVVAGVLVTVFWGLPFLLSFIALAVVPLLYRHFDETVTVEYSHANAFEELRAYRSTVALFFSNGFATLILLGMTFASFIYIGFAVYISFIVSFVDGGPAQTGLVVMLTSVVYMTSSTQAGRLAEALGSRIVPLLIANVLHGVGIAIVAGSSSLPGLWLAGTMTGLGQGLINPLYRSIVTDMAPTSVRGTAVGIAETFGRVGIVFSPVLMGIIITSLSGTIGGELAIRITLGGTAVLFSLLVLVTLLAARRVGFTRLDAA